MKRDWENEPHNYEGHAIPPPRSIYARWHHPDGQDEHGRPTNSIELYMTKRMAHLMLDQAAETGEYTAERIENIRKVLNESKTLEEIRNGINALILAREPNV